jgi:hypothetical protein
MSGTIGAMADALSVPDGGFSVDLRDGSHVRTGFAVAVHPECERVFDGTCTDADIREYLGTAHRALALPGRVLGGWRDPVTGRVYLDVSVVARTLADAMALARDNGQLAVFDFAGMVSVPVAMAVAA